MGKDLDYIIFTDGSVRRDPKTNKTYGGFGVVLYNCNRKIMSSFGGELGSRTIAFAEAWAIYRGLEYIASIAHGPANVLVLTDSKLSVDCINTYSPYWERNAVDGVWYGSNNHRVKNQRVFKEILKLQRKYPQLSIHIAHINGHLLYKNFERITKKLKQSGYTASDEAAITIIQMNGMADEIATAYSKQCQEESEEFLTLRPTEEYF